MKKFLTMLLVGIMSSVLLTTPAVAYSSSEMPNALLLFDGESTSTIPWSPSERAHTPDWNFLLYISRA